jgi:UDPglucose 6-dehydrogenase
MLNIGIIGFGVVGEATARSFSCVVSERYVYDKYGQFNNDISEVSINSDIIFVCVHSPIIDNKQDLEEINDIVSSLSEKACEAIIVIKSTVLPGTTRTLSRDFPHLKLAVCPEFLTEANPYNDIKNPDMIIIGSDDEYEDLINLHKLNFTCPIYQCTYEEAELTKCVSNIMFSAAESLNVPYESIQRMWLDDHRIGKSHTYVPGPDYMFGYGGTGY